MYHQQKLVNPGHVLRRICIEQTHSQRCQTYGVGGAVLRSSAVGGLPGRFHHPCPEWPEPARHGASAPCLGAASSSQQVLQDDYWVQIPGAVHRQTSIQIHYRSNFAVPVSQMSSVLLPGNRAGATMTPALNQRPWSTSRCFTPIRRWAGGLIGNDQVSQVDRRGQLSVFPASTAGADPRSFQIQFRIHALPEVAEVYRYWDDPGVKPKALWDSLILALPILASPWGHERVNDRVPVPVIPASTPGAPPPPSRRQCRVHIPGGAARLSRCRVRPGMKLAGPVEELPGYFAHSGVALGA